MDERDGDRVAQVGLLDLDRVSVVIANVHLTHLRDGDLLRKRQLATVLDHPLMQMKQAMRVVAGDFNSRPTSPLMRGLRDDEALGDVRDTFTFGGEEPRPSTLVRHDGSVDYILSIATQADTHPLFTSPAVVFKTPHPESSILPSDHYGVATTLVPTRMHGWLRQESSLVG
jgi:endonuclease/exonuclease/phosphatase family metal-dependent hydrolase